MLYPEHIQAITITRTGDLDVLEVTEVPFPTVQLGHVLIKVCVLRYLTTRASTKDMELILS